MTFIYFLVSVTKVAFFPRLLPWTLPCEAPSRISWETPSRGAASPGVKSGPRERISRETPCGVSVEGGSMICFGVELNRFLVIRIGP